MTLEEEIYKQEEKAMSYKSIGNKLSLCYSQEKQQRALEDYHMSIYHKQLAEWLKELKALKENDNVKEVFKDCDTCKYQNIEPDDYPCDRCMHRYINQYVYDDKREVNADAVSN